MITAAQVSKLYGIASAGNNVFSDQIVSRGPRTSRTTINITARNNFIQPPTC